MAKKTPVRISPHDLDAEVALLGGVLIDPEALPEVVDVIAPSDFYKTEHQLVFEAVMDLYSQSEPVDIVTVAGRLRDKGLSVGAAFLSRLVDAMPSAANVGAYGRTIRDKAILRAVMNAAAALLDKGYTGVDVDDYLDEAQSAIFRIAERRVTSAPKPIAQDIMATARRIDQAKGGPITGLATGFTDLDRLTSGLQPSDLIVVAGRPSMGKTSLALDIGRYAATKEVNVGIWSLEMSREQLITRLLCMEADVEFTKARSGMLSDAELKRLGPAVGRLYSASICIDDTPALSVLDLRARSRRLKRERGLGLVVVDYLQLMRGRSTERREQEISEISRGLKELAKELDVPVVAISQLNRQAEAREDKRPRLADLRESGAIEQDADVIVFVFREEVYDKKTNRRGEADLIVAKQRNGATGEVTLAFLGQSMSFRNLHKE